MLDFCPSTFELICDATLLISVSGKAGGQLGGRTGGTKRPPDFEVAELRVLLIIVFLTFITIEPQTTMYLVFSKRDIDH